MSVDDVQMSTKSEYEAEYQGCPFGQPLDEKSRRSQYAETGGEPILSFEGVNTPYADYLGADLLVAIAQPRTSEPSESSFQITSQVMELMFKLLCTEMRQVSSALRRDDTREALWNLRRLHREQTVLVAMWDSLSAMSPAEFLLFRDELGSGSGFQSAMYRQVEFQLGNKHPSMLKPHEKSAIIGDLREAFDAPSIYDEALLLLSRRGFGIDIERDFHATHEFDDAVLRAWREVYSTPAAYWDLYQLGEALMDLAYEHARWRNTHLLIVERVIGTKVGTGGTAGASWLQRAAEHRFFPELWALRSGLERRPQR